jgi:S-adenosyl-L-methionine hydrolase (adenosine-forming)
LNLITLTSDFGKQTQGVGNMEGIIFKINPRAKVINLMHGIPGFDLFTAARTMETVFFMPIGCHVCVVDPGVGTSRRAVIIKTGRGDYLIGPDNGCLMTAPRLLGGIMKAVEITNEKYMLTPVSPIFHGRHIFSPAAAYLSKGIPMERFGKEIPINDLAKAPYEEAKEENGKIDAMVIHVNHFGSLHLNILPEEWDKLGLAVGEKITLKHHGKKIAMPFAKTFGEVREGLPVIMKDDYCRIEIAINLGKFAEKFKVKAGDSVIVEKMII